jgi:hypothetical protein
MTQTFSRSHVIVLLLAFSLLSAAMLACGAKGGVNGRWVAQLPAREGQTREATFNLKAEGNKLTGTVSGRQGDNPISDGQINGDEISFTVTANFCGNEVKLLYKGKVAGNEIHFTRTREGGDQPPQEFTARRA